MQQPEDEETVDDPNEALDNQVTDTACEEEEDDYGTTSQGVTVPQQDGGPTSQGITVPQQDGGPPNSRKRKGEQRAFIEKRMGETLNLLKHVANKPRETKDRCSLFCDLLCLQLRELDVDTRDIAMNEIQNLMFSYKRTDVHHRSWSHQSQVHHSAPYTPSTSTIVVGVKLQALHHSPDRTFPQPPVFRLLLLHHPALLPEIWTIIMSQQEAQPTTL